MPNEKQNCADNLFWKPIKNPNILEMLYLFIFKSINILSLLNLKNQKRIVKCLHLYAPNKKNPKFKIEQNFLKNNPCVHHKFTLIKM